MFCPDLCLSSNNFVKRKVFPNFPRSQHRPVLISMNKSINSIQSLQKPRWNFLKARWNSFADEMDHVIDFIPPNIKNYQRFSELLNSIAKKHIPRGYRNFYVPGWNPECTELYDKFVESQDQSYADDLMKSLDETRKQKWFDCTSKIDFKHSSRKAWSLLRKLGSAVTQKKNGTNFNTKKSLLAFYL